MTLGEAMRIQILNRLAEVIGKEEAIELMNSLPPFDWHELATKDDLKLFKEDVDTLKHAVLDLTGKVNTLQSDVTVLKGGFDNFKESIDAKIDTHKESIDAKFDNFKESMDAKFDTHKESIDAKFDNFKESMDAKFTVLQATLTKEIAGVATQMAKQTRTFVYLLATFAVTVCMALAGGIIFA